MDVGALSKVVKSLFVHFQMPAVMLLQEPVMAVVGAGVRSGLVLDVGWSEAVVNVVYEMRVVGPGKHSRRGGRTYRDLWRKFLREEYSSSSSSNDGDNDQGNGIADWEIEEILSRTGWCRQSSPSHQQDETTITIPLITPTPPKTLTLPFTKLSLPAEKAFFATTTTDSPTPEYPDDDDYSLPELVYRVLRDCPIDVRAAVMQRIIITGGGSYVPGLKKRVIDEVRVLAKCRGWERVGRRVVEKGKGDMPAREEVVVEEGYQWRREATSSPEGQNDKRIVQIEVEREKFLAAVAAGGTGFPLDV
ncbi:actin-like ATPase domain-containing protein [Tuber magnatum]|uniref:Actin-like ATPase domain-containing protein n=1 Tax=Tuber magnatum TaxID=42249 RepID=A0A317SM78_9PEZI|nr:actin-like ATPase domain-containing protein [Tuber magnatum]